MVKNLRFYLFFTSLLVFSAFGAFAQNCTVNSGINTTICPGAEFKLNGTFNGLITSDATWTQISGPSVTVATTLRVGTNATALVTGYAPDVPYGFRLSAKCTDGSLVYQDVTYTVSSLGTANAGPDAYACPGTNFVLQGSALGSGETGEWTRISGSGPTITNPTSPNATLAHTTNASAVSATYRWTVSKTTGGNTCTSFDDVVITNLGRATPVSAGADIEVSCYNVTGSTTLNGSNAGASAAYGQSVLWEFISGPSTPSFDATTSRPNVTGLVEGTYVFRYTVTSPCGNGTDEVNVVVKKATQNITNVSGGTLTFCDNRQTVVLTAPRPLYAGEVGIWTRTNGGANGTITDPNNNVTTITGLSGTNGQSSTFRYTINNASTGCSSFGDYTVQFRAAPTITITSPTTVFITCGTTETAINYTTANGTGTQYALISAPAGSTRQTVMGGLNNYVTAAGSTVMLTGFDKIGTYVIRYRRNTDNGNGGCADAYADVTIVASSAPTAANAGTNQVLACNVFDTKLAGNIPTVGIGKWSQISGPNTANIVNPFANNTDINGLISGQYTFRWIISGGDGACVNAQSDVKVTVSSQTPTASVVGSNVSTCNSTPVYLTGNTPGLNETGTWTVSPSAGVVFSNVNNPSAVATGLANNTTYTFTWTITNNCSPTYPALVAPASYTITTTAIAGAKQANAGADRCLAAGTTTFTLAGNAPTGSETGTWTKVSGPNLTFTNATLYNTGVTGATNGTYVLRWELKNNGCTPTVDEVTITISGPVSAAVAGTDQRICGTSVTLAGNTPTTGIGVWTQTEGPGGAVITDINNPATTVTGLVDGRYKFTWTITNGACASSTPSTVTIDVSNPSSVAVAGLNQAICNATSTTLAATPVTNGTGNWVAVSGPSVPTFVDPTSPTTVVNNLRYGVYKLRWTSRGGVFCPPTTSDVEITVTQNANAGADRALCGVNAITLTGNENSTGTWTYVSGPAGYTLTNTGPNSSVASNLVTGVYVFKYSLPAVGSCAATEDEIQITIDTPPSPAVAGPDQERCLPTADNTTTFTMAATVPTVGTGKWELVERSAGAALPTMVDVNSATTNVTMGPGVYLYRWRVESTGACAGDQGNADVVRITVFREPSAAVPGPNQLSSCSNKVKMAATAPTVGIGTWSNKAGNPTVAVFDAVNSPTSNVTNLVNGTYTFIWTVSNGSPLCTDKSAEVVVTVTTQPVTVATVGPNQSVCTVGNPGTGSVNLVGSVPTGAETGTWTVTKAPGNIAAPEVTFNNPNAPNATADNLIGNTTYTFTWTIRNSANNTPTDCDSSAQVVVTTYNAPATSVAGPTQIACLGSAITLAATAVPTDRGIGTWSNKAGNPSTAVFSNVNDPNATVNGLIASAVDYVFIWTVSNGNCTPSTSEVIVKVQSCEIAVAKSTSTPVQQANGSYDITLTFKVKNTGGVELDDVQVVDDLRLTFPAPGKSFSIKSLVATGTLVANDTTGPGAFDGGTNQNLLKSTSKLAAGVEETITLVVNVAFN